MNIIHKSLARVAKKMAPKAEKSEEDWKQQVLERITTSQDPYVYLVFQCLRPIVGESGFVDGSLTYDVFPCERRAEAVQNADLVIEAIIENLKIKQDLFAFLDSKAK